jgi:uncharacterized protein (DUF58 family)
MAGEPVTRGRSPLLEHEARRGAGLARLRPTRRGLSVAVVAIALLALVVGTDDTTLLLLLVVVVLPLAIGPFVVVARAHRSAGTVIHALVTPPLVPVGAPSRLLVQLSHAGDRGLPPLGLDQPSDHSHAGARLRPSSPDRRRFALATDMGRLIRWERIGSDTSASLAVALPTRRRGVITIGPLSLWVHDPFGLFGQTVAVARPVTLVVHPSALAGLAPATVRPGLRESTLFGVGPPGLSTDDPGGEWSGLRPYEPGDRLHLLSWQAEARSGALLVHDFRPESEDVLSIVLDDRAGVHRRAAFERALGAVIGLASAEERHGSSYDVGTLSGLRVQGTTTPDGLVALLRFLAGARPTRSNNSAASITSALRAGAVVVTTPTAVPTLPSSLAQGSVVVVE